MTTENTTTAGARTHTPGPWYWSDEYRSQSGDKTWSLIGDDGYGILSCDGVSNSPQGIGNEANARLIAAAPDLLAALEGVVRIAGRETDEFIAARAAIAKAKGLQP